MTLFAVAGWSDITQYTKTKSIKTKLGKQHELARVETGTMTATLTSDDDRFNPEKGNGPYVLGGVKPRTPIRVVAEYEGETYPIWRGFVKSWPQKWSQAGKVSNVPIKCIDILGIVSRVSVRDYATDVLDDEPVVFWRATYGDSGHDSSGNDNDIVWNIAPSGYGGAWTGAAIRWNDDYVSHAGTTQYGTVTSDAALRLLGDRTVEAWVRLDSTTNDGVQQWLFYTNGFPEIARLAFSVPVNGVDINMYVGFNGTGWGLNVANSMKTDTWHHVVQVWENDAKRLTLYVDGINIATYTATYDTTTMSDTGQTFDIAWQGSPFSQYQYRSDWSEIAIYDRALTPGRVKSHFENSQQPFYRTVEVVTQELLEVVGLNDEWVDYGWQYDQSDTLQPYESLDSTITEQLRKFSESFECLITTIGTGQLGVYPRNWRAENLNSVVAAYTDQGGGLGYRELEMPQDDSRIRNIWIVTPEQGLGSSKTNPVRGGKEVVRDDNSIDEFGPLTQTISNAPYAGIPYYTANDQQVTALARAQSGLSKSTDSKTRIDKLVLQPGADSSAWDALLSLDIGERITVTRQPPGGNVETRELVIQQIKHDIVLDRTWRAQLQLSPAEDDDYWLIGVSLLGTESKIGW